MSTIEPRNLGGYTRDKLRSLQQEGMKSIFERDAAGRIETLWEAHITAQAGDFCLKTRFKYADGAAGSSRRITAMDESIDGWPGYTAVGGGDDEDFTSIP